MVTPLLAHVVWKSGVFYAPEKTPFKDQFSVYEGVSYDGTILNALIFTNFLMLVAAGFFLLECFRLVGSGQESGSAAFDDFTLASMIFLSFSTVIFGVAGVTEGGTLLFVSLLLFLHRANQSLLFAIVILLSAFQRELIAVAFVIYLMAQGVSTNIKYLAASICAFLFYLVARKLFPLPGHEDQLQLASYLQNILAFKPDRDFLLQGIIAQNIVWGFLALVWLHNRSALKFFGPYFCVVGVLLLLSIGTDIGPNTGRILNIALPMFLLALGQVVIDLRRQ